MASTPKHSDFSALLRDLARALHLEGKRFEECFVTQLELLAPDDQAELVATGADGLTRWHTEVLTDCLLRAATRAARPKHPKRLTSN